MAQFGPVSIPNPIPLIQRIGHLIDMWYNPCVPPLRLYVKYSGALLNKLFWTAAPIDLKHAYKFGAGESWVKSARRVASAMGESAPIMADGAGALLDMAAAADTAAFWFWIGNGVVSGLWNWTSLVHKAYRCGAPGSAGYAIAPPWGFGDALGVWQVPLWDPIVNPNSFMGIAYGFLPREYVLTNVGAAMSFITIEHSPQQQTRVFCYPSFDMSPAPMMRHVPDQVSLSIAVPIPKGIARAEFGERTHSLELRRELVFAAPMDDPLPPQPNECELTVPPPDQDGPNCWTVMSKPTLSTPTGTDHVTWGRPPPYYARNPRFTGLNWKYEVMNAGGLALGVGGEMHWVFKPRGT